MMSAAYVRELQEVILHLHGVESKHVESVPVKETFQGKTVWDGVVEVFELRGHPKAKKVYGWRHETTSKNPRYVTVLHIPPVVSPATAVKASIIQEFRNLEPTKEN
jgi:hypothetical protein